MTHEYVIALGGHILCATRIGEPAPTAVAWATGHILAVGTDEAVASISRGDSTFLDLGGCAVTPDPVDRVAAQRLLRATVAAAVPFVVDALLLSAGALKPDTCLEPGAPSDLAFWSANPETLLPHSADSLHIIAVVRNGLFTIGEPHHGPFPTDDAHATRIQPGDERKGT